MHFFVVLVGTQGLAYAQSASVVPLSHPPALHPLLTGLSRPWIQEVSAFGMSSGADGSFEVLPAGCWWLPPAIPATQEAENRRTMV
jgi:hypothetical protein